MYRVKKKRKSRDFNKLVQLINLELEGKEHELTLGKHVYYIPNHLLDQMHLSSFDLNCSEVENGIVSSINDKYIFVRFFSFDTKTGTIEFSQTAKACRRENLFPISIKTLLK